jgi:hypothetical protein
MFDVDGFMKAEFVHRTSQVKVPLMSHWFGEDEEPVFIVRGLTASEIARCNEAAGVSNTVDTIVSAITSNKMQTDQVREALGLSEKGTPAELIKRLKQMVYGCVEPVINEAVAAKIGKAHPVELMILTNEIVKLTGMGMNLAK